jgi:riboflavin kinase/FMN adenylyltransferase
MTTAVGFFDGVHVGHQAILRGADAVLTFRNHPLSVLRPESVPPLLMTFEERAAAIRACGVEDVVALDFTRELAGLTPKAFVERVWSGRAPTVRCGENWRFGRGGAGTPELLRSMGFDVEVVPYAEYGGAPVSSTRVRQALASGRLEAAAAMLGRAWEVRGSVRSGKGLGRGLGFPTVNVAPFAGGVRLPLGVYAVEVGGLHGAANYGVAPTMGERAWGEPVVEVHFLDGVPALRPGDEAAIRFLRYVREERRFAGPDELRLQIANDIEECRKAWR